MNDTSSKKTSTPNRGDGRVGETSRLLQKMRSRRQVLFGGAVLGVSSLLSNTGPFRINIAHAETGTIPIGFPVPLTGPYALEAADQVRCAQLAVDQFNARGGLDGRMAELVVRDDALNPAKAAALTRSLIKDDGVRFVVGSLSASVQLSVNAATRAAGALYISISQSDAITEAPNASKLTFHEALNPHMTSKAVGEYVFPKHGKRVAFLIADYAYGHEMARGLKRAGEAFGIEVVAEIRHPIATRDFRAFLPSIRKAKPDVLCLCNFGRDQQLSVQHADMLGLKRDMQVLAPVLLYHQRLAGGAAAYEGVVGATNYHWTLEDRLPGAKRFNEAYRACHDMPPSDYGAYAYGGVSVLLQAMEKSASTDPVIVADALQSMNYDTYKDRQWYRACDHQSVQSVFIVRSKPQEAMVNAHDVFDVVTTQQASETHLRDCAELGQK